MNPHPVHRSHPLFDVEDAIIRNRNQPIPVDLRPFQQRINGIVGLALDGKQILRIAWGQSYEQTGMVCFGRIRLKYPFYRYAEAGEIRDIGIPRFFVEQLHTNAELNYRETWEKARYSWLDGVGNVDVLGPIPEAGFYTALFQIAYHDSLCCHGQEYAKGEMCLGAYREPNDSDLERIGRMYQRREAASNDEMAPSPELIRKRTVGALERRDERWRQGIRDVIDDYMRAHAWKFSEMDPGRLLWGRYHFLGGGHTKSGLSQAALARLRTHCGAVAAEQESNASNSNSTRAA